MATSTCNALDAGVEYRGFNLDGRLLYRLPDYSVDELDCVAVEQVLFDHDFAKAFWGEDYVREEIGNWDEVRTMTTQSTPAWQYHLQQLALAEDRLAYLARFLE